jgi:hypothetical protein
MALLQAMEFVLAVGEEDYCSNELGSGFLSSQESARVRTEMRPHAKIRALAMCRDVDRRVWVYDLQGKRKSYDGKRFEPSRDFQIFWSDFYGESLGRRHRGGSQVDTSI